MCDHKVDAGIQARGQLKYSILANVCSDTGYPTELLRMKVKVAIQWNSYDV